MKSDYKFNEPENTACFTCDHVLIHNKPILYAAHYLNDGYWEFSCRLENHTDANWKIITLKEMTEIDNTVSQLSEMPLGYIAERKSISDK